MPINAGAQPVQSIPGLALKAWAQISNSGALLRSYNIGSFTKNSSGNYTLFFLNAMSSATFFPKITLDTPAATFYGNATTRQTSSVAISTGTTNENITRDLACFVEVYE